MKLHTKVLIGLLAGALVGVLAHQFSTPFVQQLFLWLNAYGRLFIRLISMVIVPLVVASMIVGIASLGDLRKLGRIGTKTLALFFLTTLCSSSISIPILLVLHPGTSVSATGVIEAPVQSKEAPKTSAASSTFTPDSLIEVIPSNPIAAASSGDLFAIIIFTMIFGAAISALPSNRKATLVSFFSAINDASMKVIDWVMVLAPTAVFCLISSTVARFGVALLHGLILFCIAVILGLALLVILIYGLILMLGARWNPLRFYMAISEAALVAFSTSSSSATLPVSIRVSEEKLEVPNSIASFVLPLGATMNKNGSALYKSAAVIFIAQIAGVKLTVPLLMRIIFAATLSAMTTGGVPGSGLIAIVVVLQASGLGAYAAIGSVLVAGVDRILDMLRTSVNVIGSMVCATYIARSERARAFAAINSEISETS